jgi:hypothetical protein
MRILSVQLRWLYASNEGDEGYTVKKRRDALSNLGFDVTKITDDAMQSPNIGMTDAQFVELSIAGEPEMQITATVIVDAE